MQFYIYISNFSNQPMTKENKSQQYVLEKHRDYFIVKVAIQIQLNLIELKMDTRNLRRVNASLRNTFKSQLDYNHMRHQRAEAKAQQ